MTNCIKIFLSFCLALCWLCRAFALFGDDHALLTKGQNIKDLETRLEYARVLSYLKKYDESIEEYQKVLLEKPDLIQAKIEMAKIYYFKKDYDQALHILQGIPKDMETNEIDLVLGDIYVAQKDYAKAEEIYKKILKNSPKNDEIKFKLADMLSWQKRYAESLQLYEELLEQYPQDIQLRRKFAMVLLWSGKDSEAAQELKKTLN